MEADVGAGDRHGIKTMGLSWNDLVSLHSKLTDDDHPTEDDAA